MVDPGHGGEDAGVTAGGIEEKSVVLDWALALRDRLSREGDFVVLLTRDQDVNLAPDQRAVKVNQTNAHLYVGVHVNHALGLLLSGMMVRVYKPGLLPKRSGPSHVVWFSQAQTSMSSKSRSAALEIIQGLTRAGEASLREGPWSDLKSLAVPALAVELGFAGTPAESNRWSDAASRNQVIEALVEGLKSLRSRWGL